MTAISVTALPAERARFTDRKRRTGATDRHCPMTSPAHLAATRETAAEPWRHLFTSRVTINGDVNGSYVICSWCGYTK